MQGPHAREVFALVGENPCGESGDGAGSVIEPEYRFGPGA